MSVYALAISVIAARKLPAACRRTKAVSAAADDAATNAAINGAINADRKRIMLSPCGSAGASADQPLTGAARHPSRRVDADNDGHEHNTESNREREIALRSLQGNRRSEERRVGKECRSRWSP